VRLIVVVVLSACSFEHGSPARRSTDAAIVDAGVVHDGPNDGRVIDATVVMPDAKVCPQAPAGCSLFSCSGSTSCYFVCGTSTSGQLSWGSARTRCTNAGIGCIVTINSQAEQECIATRTMPVYPDNVWFGLRQISTSNEPAGGWAWECGTSTYVAPNWGGSEPNNQGGNEDCGILATGGGWNDGECDTPSRYVCELP
jgi:hypothetical protein